MGTFNKENALVGVGAFSGHCDRFVDISTPQAVAEYVSTLSWRRLLLNLLDPGLNDLLDLPPRTRPRAELGLDNEATWGEAVTKTLARQGY